MKRKSPIMELKETLLPYKSNEPIHIEIADIRHSDVHYHKSDLEIVYCLEGAIHLICNHESQTLHKGEMFTINYQDIHCIYSDSPNISLIFHIDMRNLDKPLDFLESIYLGCQDYNCKKEQLEDMRKIKNMILSAALLYFDANEFDAPGPSGLNLIANRIVDLMLASFDLFDPINTYPYTNEELRNRMHQIVKYCQDNYKTKISISKLSQMMYINDNYFSQFMRNSLYGSFSNMLGYIRAYEAQFLLLTTPLSILDISHMCGFSDDKYFYKQFKLWWKKTPHEYRSWHKEYIKSPVSINKLSTADSLHVIKRMIIEHAVRNALYAS